MALTQSFIFTCSKCDTDIEYLWQFPDRVETPEDITDDDVEDRLVSCTHCGHTSLQEYPGWQSHDDAG